MSIDALALLGPPELVVAYGGVTVAQFRADFPEFADQVRFTDAAVARQLRMAAALLGEQTWGDLWGYGIELRAAHYLTLGARTAATAAVGGLAGAVTGILTSKSVDKVSASYLAGAVTNEGAGFWNTTSYGVEFYQLMLQMGAGPIQL